MAAEFAQENLEIIEWLRKRDEKYTSPEIKKELLEALALGMMWQISANIQNATFFTIMADETADVSNKEQPCIRWVDDCFYDGVATNAGEKAGVATLYLLESSSKRNANFM